MVPVAEFPTTVQSWISRGASSFIVNRCPRCSVCLAGELRDLLAGDSYVKIWAIDQATRSCKGEVEVRRIIQYQNKGSMKEMRASLELIRDHIDCGIPYQLIAFTAGAQEDAAAKTAACERLKEFGPRS